MERYWKYQNLDRISEYSNRKWLNSLGGRLSESSSLLGRVTSTNY